jgi:hypothetical protein
MSYIQQFSSMLFLTKNQVKYQPKGEVNIDSANGLMWHTKLKDDQYKERV